MSIEKKKTILLVDDEAIVAMAEKMTLEKYGYTVIPAHSGEEAVTAVERIPGIDLILMDINLGKGIDGTEAAARILKEHDLPVVFLSSHTEPEVVEKTEKITSYGYVVKDSSGTVLDASIKMAFKLFEARTREKEEEKALKESEHAKSELLDKLNEAQRLAMIGSWEWDLQTNLVWWSEETYRIFGVNPQDFVPSFEANGKFIHPDDFAIYKKSFEQSFRTGELLDVNLRLIANDGELKHCHAKGKIIYDDSGQAIRFIGTLMDITGLKRAEEELTKSNQYIKSILDNMPIGLAVNTIDDGIVGYINENFTRIYGWPKEALSDIDQFFEKVYPGVEGKELKAKIIHDMSSCDPKTMSWDDLKITTSTGEHKYISARNIPIPEQNLMVSTVWDTTRIHESQEALRENEGRYRAILNASPYGISITDLNGRIRMVSPAVLTMIGCEREEEMLGRLFTNFVFPDDRNRASSDVTLMSQRTMMGLGEYQGLRIDGSAVDLEVNGDIVRGTDGRPTQMVFIIRDISERKRAEKLTGALYTISQAVYATDNLNGLFTQIHCALSGIIPTNNLFIAILSADGKVLNFPYNIDEKDTGVPPVIAADDSQSLSVEVLVTKKPLLLDETELLDRYASGRNRVWGMAPKCWLGVPLMIKETAIGVLAVQDYHKPSAYSRKDVTLLESAAGQIAVAIERKRAEKTLHESIDAFKEYFNMGTVGMCVTSLEKGWIEVNDCLCRMLGYSREELVRLTWAEMTHPDDLDADVVLFNQMLAGQRDSYELEKRFICKDGQVIHALLYATCQRNPDGTVHHLLASLVDISERKRAEAQKEAAIEAQRAAQQLIEGIINAMPVRVFWKDRDLVYLGCNAAFARDAGFSDPKDIAGKDDFQMGWRDQAEMYRNDDRQVIESGRSKLLIEEPQTTPTGQTLTLLTSKMPLRNAKGEINGVLGTYMDITERMRAEEALRESEEWNKAILHTVLSGVIVIESDTRRIVDANDMALKLIGLPKEQVIGFVCHRFVCPAEEKNCPILDLGKKVDFSEKILLSANGDQKNIIKTVVLVQWRGRKYLIESFVDISERKRVEEEIQRQLAEKEILLREVHHRIKNNIAAIGGLLALRLQSIANPEAVAVLQDAIGRVDSMRILYDKLLLSEGYKDIPVKNYVESLTDSVLALFPGSARITVDKRIMDFHLDAKKLFPLGIIINELLTNKMKYAFSDRDSGSIQITLERLDKHITLTIEDDGNELPNGFDADQSKGFGLMLVKMLSQQLGGSFAMEKQAGTRCVLEFYA